MVQAKILQLDDIHLDQVQRIHQVNTDTHGFCPHCHKAFSMKSSVEKCIHCERSVKWLFV